MLNDILDLCISKSKDGVFYSFSYSTDVERLTIIKDNGPVRVRRYNKEELEWALEFMENE